MALAEENRRALKAKALLWKSSRAARMCYDASNAKNKGSDLERLTRIIR
jgi:hypothetical protein